MALDVINLGTEALDGSDGDDWRTAFTKAKANFEKLDARAPAVDPESVQTANVITTAEMDLALYRNFHFTQTGDIALSFANIPTGKSLSWTLKLTGGGYAITSYPSVEFVDGSSFDDLDLNVGQVNIVVFNHMDGVTFGSIIATPKLVLDPYKLSFQVDGTITILTDYEALDTLNHSTYGDGGITFTRNGSPLATSWQVFQKGDRLGVTCTGATSETLVSVPRYLP